MIVITDSNIFISALITPMGVVASVLNEKGRIQFLAPSYIVDEVKTHSEKIAFLAQKTEKETWADFKDLLIGIEIIDVDKMPKKYLLQAEKIVREIDIKNAFFVALSFLPAFS